MGQTDKKHLGNNPIICESAVGSSSSPSIKSEVDTNDRCRSGRRTKHNNDQRSSSSLSVTSVPEVDRKYRSSSRTRSLSPAVKTSPKTKNICHNSQNRYGNTLTVEDCFGERPSSALSMKSEPELRKRHNSGCKTKRPSSAVFYDEFVNKNGLNKIQPASENSTEHLENVQTEPDSKKNLERVIDGATMSHFYTLWNRKPRSAPLGRGKLELPNSLMMMDKYRKCGCETRLHQSSCRTC